MKAKIKKTGEIINIAEHATITLDDHDSWGNPIEVKPEDVELIQEQTEDEHWQAVRVRAAISALQGLLSNTCRAGSFKDYAVGAVAYANALIEELKKE